MVRLEQAVVIHHMQLIRPGIEAHSKRRWSDICLDIGVIHGCVGWWVWKDKDTIFMASSQGVNIWNRRINADEESFVETIFMRGINESF